MNDVKINGDNIYAATNYGAFIYNTITKQSTAFKNIPNNANSISSNLVRNIHYSKSSNFYGSTLSIRVLMYLI